MTKPIPFSGFPLDRASPKRRDAAFIDGLLAHPDSDLILIQDGRPILDAQPNARGDRILLRLASATRSAVLGDALPPPVFLGLDAKRRASFAVSVPRGVELEAGPFEGLGEAIEMRAAAGMLQGDDLALAGTAKALFDWHAKHGFCANCGTKSNVAEAGWKRICPSCGTEHFPRTDPVAIMLAVKGDQCLLGRGPGFPSGFISALAGFIEPGESIEEGCARELMEEAGVKVISARIVSNQPWPFPSQLMIGLIAEVESFDLHIDPEEIAEAIWFSKEQARALLSPRGCTRDGVTFRAPPPLAIAHHLIKDWVNSD